MNVLFNLKGFDIMLENEFYIELKNDCYLDSSITNEQLVTYVLLQKNYNKAKQISMVNINSLLDYMYLRKNDSKRFIKDIRTAINGLLDKGLIKDIYDIHFNKVNFDTIDNKTTFIAEIEPCTTEYFKVYEKDIDIIFRYLKGTNIKKFNLLRYYIAVMRVISNQQRFGYLTQKQCKELIGENKTISSYNDTLQDLQLIIFNNDYLISENQYSRTFFGKFNDKDNFNKQLTAIVEYEGLIKTDKTSSNEKRSIKQKANIESDNSDTDESNILQEINNLSLDSMNTDECITNEIDDWQIEEDNNDVDKDLLNKSINNIDVLRKFFYPNEDYYSEHFESIKNGTYTVKQLFDDFIEFEEYDDYIKFIKTQIEFEFIK